MSGIALIYSPGTQVNKKKLARVMPRLSHRGPDGNDSLYTEDIAIGHWHFWTTPEELDEKQPLQINNLIISFDGRIDNREELFKLLEISVPIGNKLSDAALVLRAYQHWDENCVKHFVGEFALAIFDAEKKQLFCARDHLGDRTLFYAIQETQVVIASEPWAVAGTFDEKPSLSEKAVAHHFTFKPPQDGQSFFEGIYELLPAHGMVINASGLEKWRYWQPDPTKKIRYEDDEEYARHFLSLLEESVRVRMRSSFPVGVLMSGGLDSTSVASLAARMIAPQKLTTISYVFNELSDCDESHYINIMQQKWSTRSIQIPSDDAWPYKKLEEWEHNPNAPESNPYRQIKNRAYQRANEEGLQILLTGGFGDHLYDGAESWLHNLIEDGKFKKAVQGFIKNARSFGLLAVLKAGSSREVLKYLIRIFIPNWHISNRIISPAWLTDYSTKLLEKSDIWLEPTLASKKNLLGLTASRSATIEIGNVNRYALELRHPYRDRRLVEFVLALPAYQLYANGVYKHILRTAMRDILPEAIRVRKLPASLVSLYSRGLKREKKTFKNYIHSPNAYWRKFVKIVWVSKRWDKIVTRDNDGINAVVPWLCFSYEIWSKHFFGDIMLKNIEITSPQTSKLQEKGNLLQKVYHKPYLEKLGDLRTLTLGGSPGTGDSGATGGSECLLGFC